MAIRAAVYLRISDDQAGEQLATGRQRKDCLEFCERNGWEVADVFEDIDYSGFTGKRRPGFESMLAAVREGEAGAVVAWKIDRLHRNLRDFVRLDETCAAAGAIIRTLADGVDTSTPSGQMVATMLVAQGRMESANTSTRVKRAMAQHAAEGKPRFGPYRAFGYDRRMDQIEPDEAEFIREAVRRLLAGETLYSICRDFNARGSRTSRCNEWSPTTLKRVVTSAYISGQREHLGVLSPGKWEAIISPQDLKRVRAMVAARARPGRPALSPLAGIIKCGVCHQTMSHWVQPVRPRRYRCSKQPGALNCGHVTVAADPVEKAVGEAVLVVVEGVELPTVAADNSAAADAIIAIEADMAELAGDYYNRKLIGKVEFLSVRDDLQAKLDKARAALARVPASNRPVKQVGRDEWEAMDVGTRREIAAMLLDRVEVLPAPKVGRVPFDPKRLVFIWRA
jgi:site-specific DNA recombinase